MMVFWALLHALSELTGAVLRQELRGVLWEVWQHPHQGLREVWRRACQDAVEASEDPVLDWMTDQTASLLSRLVRWVLWALVILMWAHKELL